MNRATASRLAVAIVTTVLAGAASAQALRLVTEESYPFQYLENKKLAGMAVDVVSEMAKRAGVPVEHELMSWKDAYERAQRDRNTCVYSTARLENRERLFRWVGPIVANAGRHSARPAQRRSQRRWPTCATCASACSKATRRRPS